MAGTDHRIRQNDLIEIHPDCHERHARVATLPGCEAAGLRVAGIGYERTTYRIARRSRIGHQLLLSLAGEGWVELDGRRHRVGPGELLRCPQGLPQRYGIPRGGSWDILWFTFDPERGPWTRLFGARGQELGRWRWGRPLRNLVQALLREGAEPDVDDPELQRHLVQALLRYLRRELDQAGGADGSVAALLEQVLEEVRADPAADWSVARLLRRSGLDVTPDHFTRLCRRLLGSTPMRLVAEVRLRQATELLVGTDYTLALIAGLVGYATPFALSNALARRVGSRPREIRAKALA